jgi:hypothetical protein
MCKLYCILRSVRLCTVVLHKAFLSFGLYYLKIMNLDLFFHYFHVLNNVMKPDLGRKQFRLKLHNILASQPLLCGFKIWILKQRDK